MSKKDFSDKAKAVIILLLGIIIGGFAYFVADNLTDGELGQNAIFKFRSYKVQDFSAPSTNVKLDSSSLNYAKPIPDGN